MLTALLRVFRQAFQKQTPPVENWTPFQATVSQNWLALHIHWSFLQDLHRGGNFKFTTQWELYRTVIKRGTVVWWLVYADRAVQVRTLSEVTVHTLCSWARQFTVTVPLSVRDNPNKRRVWSDPSMACLLHGKKTEKKTDFESSRNAMRRSIADCVTAQIMVSKDTDRTFGISNNIQTNKQNNFLDQMLNSLTFFLTPGNSVLEKAAM